KEGSDLGRERSEALLKAGHASREHAPQGGCLLVQLPLDQWQAVVAEKHCAVDENRGRAETTALDQLFGIGAQPGLVIGGGKFQEVFLFVEPDLAHDAPQYLALTDVAIGTPIAFKNPPRVGRDLSMLFGDEYAAHGLDRVDRKDRRTADLESVEAR